MLQSENERYRALLSQDKDPIPTSDVSKELLALFDEGTFSEIGALRSRISGYNANTHKPCGVICGYGAVDGALVFAFAQDITRGSAALELQHAEKVEELYRMAKKAGAPIIGIFDSEGVDIEGGVTALSAYGRILSAVADAKGKIPQIALILGTCRGLFAATAAGFDFIVREQNAVFGATASDASPLYAFTSSSRFGGTSFIHDLLSYLPRNASVGVEPTETADSLNRRLPSMITPEDTDRLLASLADNSMHLKLYADAGDEVTVEFAVIGGIRTGIIATVPTKAQGRLSASGAKKLSAFIDFCSRFRIPILSLIYSHGLADENSTLSLAEALSAAVSAYVTTSVPKIAVILGKAIGPSAVLFGCHEIGTDVVYAIETAEIGALPTSSSVAFAWQDRITSETPRSVLEKLWLDEKSSAYAAARDGAVDDVISFPDLRKRVASALLMLTAEGTARKDGIS